MFPLSGVALEFSDRKSLALTGSHASWKPGMLTSFGTSETVIISYITHIGTLDCHNMTRGICDSMMLLAKQRLLRHEEVIFLAMTGIK